LTQCTTGRITVCPINTALYDVQSLTCEAKLFFQTAVSYSACKSMPILQRHRTEWVYHFPILRQFTIRCPNGNNWRIYNEVLSEAVIIHNATACSILPNEVRTLPQLHGSAYAKMDTPSLCLPDVSPILEVHEVPQLKKLFRRRPESWINSGHIYKLCNGSMNWTRYFNYGRPHRFEKVSRIGT
jgi:hypothetical protein